MGLGRSVRVHICDLEVVTGTNGQHFIAVAGHSERMLPLGGQASVFGDYRPTIAEQLHVAFTDVDHRLDREGHAFLQPLAGSRSAVVQHLWVFVKDLADAVTAIFPNYRASLLFSMLLDGVADVAEVDAWLDHLNAYAHALMAYSTDTFGLQRRLADQEHFAGVAVVAVFDDCDINVDDVAVLETFVAGNSMANLMINRGANGFGKPVVVEWRRDRLLLVDNVPMTDVVQLTGGDTRHDMRPYHFEHFGR